MSRAIRFLRIASGMENIFIPDFVRSIQEKFRFVDVPQKLEEFDTTKGATFRHGLFNGSVIDVFQIYENGVLVECKASPTELGDEFVNQALAWAADKYALIYADEQKRAYFSEIELVSDQELMKTLNKMRTVGELLGAKVSGYGRECPSYHPSGIHLAPNFTEDGTAAAGRFIFERRGGIPFEKGVFYSQAPLATADHLAVAEMLEKVL